MIKLSLYSVLNQVEKMLCAISIGSVFSLHLVYIPKLKAVTTKADTIWVLGSLEPYHIQFLMILSSLVFILSALQFPQQKIKVTLTGCLTFLGLIGLLAFDQMYLTPHMKSLLQYVIVDGIPHPPAVSEFNKFRYSSYAIQTGLVIASSWRLLTPRPHLPGRNC